MAKTETFMEILHFLEELFWHAAEWIQTPITKTVRWLSSSITLTLNTLGAVKYNLFSPASSQIGNHLRDNNDRQKIYLKRVFIIQRVYWRGVMPLINVRDVLVVVWFTATVDIFYLKSWCLGPWRTARVDGEMGENGLYLSDLNTTRGKVSHEWFVSHPSWKGYGGSGLVEKNGSNLIGGSGFSPLVRVAMVSVVLYKSFFISVC